jgi:FkbM family methyltransferase
MRFLSRTTRNGLFKELIEDNYMLRSGRLPTMDLLDIGANVGMVSLTWRMAHPEVNIAAFEPFPPTLAVLKDNLANMRVAIYDQAIGDGTSMRLKTAGKECRCVELEKGEGGSAMRSVSLGDMFAISGLKPETTIIKIDVEGGEKVLVGDTSSEAILNQSAAFLAELHELTDGYSLDTYHEWLKVNMPRHVILKQEVTRKRENLVMVREDLVK